MRNLQKKLLKDSNFVIYNASAGSGKTYSLTKRYLQLLLSGNSTLRFKRMLAITFTNKAVGEMKSRILDSLFLFSQANILEDEHPMFNELCSELALSPQQMQKRCEFVLKQILHNYAFFEISTIDKFNHKIIKTFARDLQISQNFEVELNVEALLEKAVSSLLDRTGENPILTQALLDFSLEKIEEDKSWNIAFDLMGIGKLLFQENHFSHLESFKEISITDFKKEQSKIGKHIASLEKKVKSTAQSALEKILEFGFVPKDFPRETLPNHFRKITQGEYNPRVLYKNQLEDQLINTKILKAKDTRDVFDLSVALLDCFTSIKQNLYQRILLKNIYSNIVPLTVLNEISKELKRLEEEDDVIPISALNQLISKQIKNQPVPFIYERLGEKYRHYFIDEFQDTSKMQWENLVPLISNALESQEGQGKKGSLFLVGDIKQAIYRWRGGSSEQFLKLLNARNNPFVLAPTIERLETNWRSHSNIIEFNNSFFSHAANAFQSEMFRSLFEESCIQKPNSTQGGYANIGFIDGPSNDKDQLYCGKVLEIITELTEKGYAFKDICILVRKNTTGSTVAHFLSQQGIPIVSSDSLLLAQNDIVEFLVSLLKMIDNPKDKNFVYEVLSFLFTLRQKGEKHDFITAHIDSPIPFFLDKYNFDLLKFSNKSVYEILDHAILQFDLSEGSEAFITFLMDEVIEVEKKDGSSIMAFLDHWERKKSSLSVAAPNSLDAVQIMTIHKSKGLEFPVVIFPYANSKINENKNKIWVDSEELELDLNLEKVLVNTSSETSLFPERIREAHLEEQHNIQMDAMNVLYVALTRAEKALYVVTDKEKVNPSQKHANSYAQLFQLYLKNVGLYSEELLEYHFGELPETSSSKSDKILSGLNIPYHIRPLTENDLSISTIRGQLWGTEVGEAIEVGNLVHYALAQIEYQKDIPAVLEELESDALFQGHDFDILGHRVKATVFHPLIAPYFSEKNTIYKEQEILTSSGQKLRPDRIAILDNEATVLDFKTGKQDPKHKTQIIKYGEALKHMGFSIKNTIIVYIGEDVQPLFL
ncbi:UvrD-helicase domain-containing protein [Flagellimonas sp.]|uniref:UvrD-helicase domain-containing protein n=1 Tax=Flagellimonas sp. TaxID=2058762 RepID=UPI003F4A367C